MSKRARSHLIVGTAGHVDHGKSTLVQALTGTDPDRLPEEKKRGLTIDLGFAFLSQPEAVSDIAFIDCPGHKKFVRHMVAGSGSIDGALLVIAADDGIMPQTREHVEALQVLGVPWGRVIISKSDLVDTERLQVLRESIVELLVGTVFLEDEPLALSAHTGAGLTELRAWLSTRAEQRRATVSAKESLLVRLPIDRVFTVKGHGTIVTGTLLSGTIKCGDQLDLFPQQAVRVRGIQVHKQSVDRACAGQRCAINIAGISHHAVSRGSWLATAETLRSVRKVAVDLDVLSLGICHRQRVQVYHGTTRSFARVSLIGCDQCEGGLQAAVLHLETGLALRPGDRCLLRRASPAANVAGATVLHIAPPRLRRKHEQTEAFFHRFRSDAQALLQAELDGVGLVGLRESLLAKNVGDPERVKQFLLEHNDIVQCGERYISGSAWAAALNILRACISEYLQHYPERCWLTLAFVRKRVAEAASNAVWQQLLDDFSVQGGVVFEHHITDPTSIIAPSSQLYALMQSLEDLYKEAAFAPPYNRNCCNSFDDPELASQALRALRERGFLIAVNDRLHVHRAHLEKLVDDAHQAMNNDGRIDVQWMKNYGRTSRKYAVPIMTWLDEQGVTVRLANDRSAGLVRTIQRPVFDYT